MQEKTLEEEFIEKSAYLEHERWSKWQSYFFSKCSVKPQSQVNGMDDRYVYLALPKDLYERWVRQMNTSYNELSEQEKESDRLEVRKYIPLVTEIISSREEKAREEGRKEERQFILNVLDGIDIADKEMGIVGGTQAIRLALQNRII